MMMWSDCFVVVTAVALVPRCAIFYISVSSISYVGIVSFRTLLLSFSNQAFVQRLSTILHKRPSPLSLARCPRPAAGPAASSALAARNEGWNKRDNSEPEPPPPHDGHIIVGGGIVYLTEIESADHREPT
jgi:hypothetical protein